MIYVLERSLRLLHPMMPFISEELWQRMPRSGETICLSDFPVTNAAQLDGRAEKEMSFVIELVTRFRSIRSTFNLSPSTPLEARIAPADPEHRAIIESMSDHIRRLAKLGQLDLVDSISSGRGSARAIISGAEIEIPLAGLIDFDKERERLERELGKLSGERDSLEKPLANSDFVQRAAADVVTATQDRAAEVASQLAKLQAMIDAL